MSDHLLETQTGGIATLTMNRPEARNAMSGEMMEGLREALPRLAAPDCPADVPGCAIRFCSSVTLALLSSALAPMRPSCILRTAE